MNTLMIIVMLTVAEGYRVQQTHSFSDSTAHSLSEDVSLPEEIQDKSEASAKDMRRAVKGTGAVQPSLLEENQSIGQKDAASWAPAVTARGFPGTGRVTSASQIIMSDGKQTVSETVVDEIQTPDIIPVDASRRALVGKAAAGAAALVTGVGSASAKAGQFGKQEIFGFGTSSPYVGEKVVSGGKVGSTYNDDLKSTYGYAPTGDILAKGYASDVSRERKVYDKTVRMVSSLQGDIDSKTWWRVRDQLRGTDVYSLRSSMLALNNVLPAEKKAEAAKAYKKVFVEMEALDLACQKKEQALATKENNDLLVALAAYKAIAITN